MILQNFKNGYNVTDGSILATSEKNDCAVRAVANAFNVNYDIAHTFAADVLGRKAKRGVIGMYTKLIKANKVTFDLFEDTLFPETKTFKLVGNSSPINTAYKHKKVKYTVKTFCAKYNNGTYIILVKGHALSIINGVVVDNAKMQFTGYRRPVESFIKVC
tara:strand:- start:66 stop:545 length:480 start_codon:yes stop_codon:yes gene_type:complete